MLGLQATVFNPTITVDDKRLDRNLIQYRQELIVIYIQYASQNNKIRT